MADISTLNGYNLKDAQARSDISTLNGKIGVASGIAELDNAGKVPSSQLPSYVDDVLEYASQSAFPATGETGKIYIALDTNKTYRWSGSAYVEISESLALGETSSTAYAGNKGKANADAISAMKDGSSIDSFGDVETALATLQPKNLSHSIAGESTVEGALDAIAAGSGVTVDDAMSSSSTNPVQNKVITSALAGKQDTLTFDNFPTAGSSNPVKSGGVKSATSEIWGVIGTIEAGLTSTHAYEVGDHIICWIGFAEVIAPIAVGDELVRNVNVVEGDVAEAVSDNLRGIKANTQLIADTVGFSGANLNGTKYETRSASNVNFTVQTDGGVAIGAGTAGSSNAQTPNDSNLATASFEAKYTGQVTLIGGYNENIHIVPYDYTDSARPYKDSAMSTRLGGSDNAYPNHDVSFYMIAGHKYSMNIRVIHGTVVPSGVVVYAMLCKQELLDKSYEPYRNTTAFPRDEQKKLGAVNIAPPLRNVTDRDVTISTNSNDVSTITGTANANGGRLSLCSEPFMLKAGRYRLVIIQTNISVPFSLSNKSTSAEIFATTDPRHRFTLDSDTEVVVGITVTNGTTYNGTIKYMICLDSDPDNEIVPYAMTNRELTEGLSATTLTYTPNARISVDGGYSHVLHAFNDVKVFLDFTVGNADISASDAVITLTGGKPKNARHTGVTIRNVTDSTYDIKMAIIETDGKIRIGGQTFVASKRYQICCDFFL